MGQYHCLVNLDKKQVVHPNCIGNGFKLRRQIGGPYTTATALVLLLAASCKHGGRGGGDFHSGHPLIGSWAGDRIAFLGDYTRSDDLPGLDAALIYEQCHGACPPGRKGERPEGWQAWTDLSPLVREMMAAEFGIRYENGRWLENERQGNQPGVPSLCPDTILTADNACFTLAPKSPIAAARALPALVNAVEDFLEHGEDPNMPLAELNARLRIALREAKGGGP